MAAPLTNWVYDKGGVSEKDIKALEKAKAIEKKRIKEGYRYFKIGDKMQVLLPCDKNGNPTEQGQSMIDIMKERFYIK